MNPIVKKAINIANLNEDAQGKIIQFTSVSASTLKNQLGETIFEQYIALPEDGLVPGDEGFVEYPLLTTEQKMRRDLETAQAYFLLYFAVPGLKEFSLGEVTLDRATFGEGQLVPSQSTSLERYQKMFWNMATKFCDKYTSTGDISVSVI
ncbi:MAG: hypothetical protein RBT65_16810 [Methanolobus sp.]|nr:hypothetical protein [Methanolobus sp.]